MQAADIQIGFCKAAGRLRTQAIIILRRLAAVNLSAVDVQTAGGQSQGKVVYAAAVYVVPAVPDQAQSPDIGMTLSEGSLLIDTIFELFIVIANVRIKIVVAGADEGV